MESPSNQLRIRNNATVRKIVVTDKQIDEAINSGEVKSSSRQVAEGSIRGVCCICRDSRPEFEVLYPLPYELLRREKYCEDCIKKVYQRESSE